MGSKTVAEKMYLKPGMQIGLFNAPEGMEEKLGLPEGIEIKGPGQNQNLDAMLGFIENRAMMEQHLDSLLESMGAEGALWIAYYKGSASVDTDINRDSIYKYCQSLNLKGVGMVSIDDDWTGFRFKKV